MTKLIIHVHCKCMYVIISFIIKPQLNATEEQKLFCIRERIENISFT